MKKVVLSPENVKTMADAHRVLARELSFPDWYGYNLDALHDCLTDIFEDVTVVIDDPEALEKNLGECFSRLTEVLTVSSGENRHLFFEG